MEEIAAVYARSLFEVAMDSDKLDDIRAQLGEFTDALEGSHEMQVFFFSPYFSTQEKEDGLEKAVSGADPVFENFLKLLIENHRMPVLFRVRRAYEDLWREENKLLPVQITSAVELDQRRSRRSATRSPSRPAARSTSPPRSSRTSSGASSCASATPCWTPPSGTDLNN